MGSNSKKNIQAAIVLLFLAAMAVASSQRAEAPHVQNWRPNNPTKGVRYVGSQVCAQCHSTKVKTQPETPMGRALAAPANCEILSAHASLKFQNGKYKYQITRDGNASLYTVTDGGDKISVPIFYCFGKGEGGQTYVLQYKDRFYESRVSFYNDTGGLDITMGHVASPPSTIVEAMGREMEMGETRNCFGCHSTNSLDGARLQFDQLMEGVTCEACHGPGEKHVSAMKEGDFTERTIFNPKRLSTEETSNFCGTCHRTWEQVALMGLRGVHNVRFQPYRLANSKCYDPEDKRISCTACHDPHENRKHDAAFYDAKCTACHKKTAEAAQVAFKQSGERAFAVCSVGKSNCVSCHMPRYEIPGSHLKFADHHIRVVRPGESYPN